MTTCITPCLSFNYTLIRFRHPNLVTLIGYSNQGDYPRCLIYEFMPNGTLEDVLEFGVRIIIIINLGMGACNNRRKTDTPTLLMNLIIIILLYCYLCTTDFPCVQTHSRVAVTILTSL